MISVLAQERLLGAALGSALTAVVVFENRRNIYKTISENNAKFDNHSQVKRPIFETKSFEVAHLWNKAVHKTFGTVIASLSSRGW
ncbi:hypothetical protein SOVF_122010 isoform B [Spinacia oleracea]|uniref:Uncharacterized protein n=1 Tax=Spinacia oleracea TaxID=3562 RepID=A0A9R0J035_SPIOL|nr:uncharacterized protein LOC110797910 [Spinacia oleracea]KNA12850.1 hypothetical protein SOVF_122010 isoform B [Spinacia oleracea]